ncbi:MAG: OmpA family protein [Planctomycetes bacterium]|nr:OmpA family protein [Planctomycetota bacterium]
MSDPNESGSNPSPSESKKSSGLGTEKTHVFKVKKKTVLCLEIEDVLFHHASAVFMPAGITSEDPTGAQNRISGLAVIRAAYMHASDHPDQKLLIAGHTDTTGSDSVNETLSQKRAQGVLHVLAGERDPWVEIARKDHQPEDIEALLTWVAARLGWPCAPPSIDAKLDAADEKAVRAFQENYKAADFGEDIAVDGIVGKQTWGAFFQVMMVRLQELTETDATGLAELRGKVHWLYDDLKSLGCGEYHPIDSPYRDDHESQVNRRVELLFFDPGEEPAKKPGSICHAGSKAKADSCPLFNPRLYCFERVVPKNLEIQAVDDHFAPGVESLDIHYRIEGLTGDKVTLEISSAHYADGPIYSVELSEKEKTDGKVTIAWDGQGNCTKGDLKDRFIHPLYSPYKVKLSDGSIHADEATFQVLYHSVKLHRGAWTPDEKAPPKSEKKAWVQYKLDELGYYGGPVGADFDDYLKKAVIRYKANHKGMHELDYSDYDDSLSDKLIAALEKDENRRDYFVGDALTDSTKTSKIMVEALTYEEGEFTDNKFSKENGRLNRPLIPIEAEVLLKKKDDSAVSSPKGVGPARINWRFSDPDEDLTPQYTSTATEPSLTKKYLEKALKLNGGRTGSNGDNCPADFGGIRKTPADDWKAPVVLGKKLEPFDVKEDSGQKVVYSEAATDRDKDPKRLGRAGFLFRPSNVAGDDYKITAELDFTGRGNKADLEKAHGVTDDSKRLEVESGILRVRRFARIAVEIQWPARTNSSEWPKVVTEYDKAHVEVDTGSIAVKPITDFLKESEYKEIVADNTSHKKKDVKLDPSSLVGVKLPKQGSMKASDYRAALRSFTNDNYWDKIYKDLRKKLSENIRKEHPTGFIVVDFLTHHPVNIQTHPPGNTTVSAANTNYVTWTFSIGLPDSVIFADQKDPDQVYYVVAHEMGHNFWLKHWEHTGKSQVNNDHDQADHNCIMSYSSGTCAHAHHRPGTYTPHFCGQCNLKLRGWDIDEAAVPADSS